jgi:Tol biopolymer transport system component
LRSPQTKVPVSWSSDGRYLLFEVNDEKTGDDLWALPLFGGGSAFPIANGSSDQTSGSFSPDNRWVAFESNESGRPEVYVQAFPEAGEKWQVSLDGGGDPQWRADGQEIFYVGLDGTLMAAPVSSPVDGGKQIEPRKPVPLFHTRIVIGRGRSHQYAVTRNGQRFLLIVPVETAPPPITVLLNWAKR